ncbi:trace amine-associated receptor 13c-like [Melanotaenia boesemani]|uniref:trace amine-associated receptor 13c-like n=1 Tax=Melanotaenia boesemani TaxID=1250792 RepID=UPI001C058908|nr:trace amine-associated receptor 13c-like [Melanotaenia boesemani]
MEMEEKVELCFPELLNTSCRKPTLPWSEAVLVNTLLSSFSLITTALNLLVIISVSHFRQLHTPTNILLLSLAVSDFLVGLLLMPAQIFRKSSCWFLGDLLCFLYNCFSFIITSASIGDMVLISVDRYVAICDPLHYPTRITVRRVKLSVCLCWFFSLLYSCVILKDDLKQPRQYDFCYGKCVPFMDYSSKVVDLVITFIAPVTVIVVLYMNVFVVAVSHARAMRSQVTIISHQASVTATRRKSELKAARTLGVLVVVFLICFCPFYCVSLLGDYLMNVSSESYVVNMFFLNSCINPVIYSMFYPWFRKAIRLIITLKILQPGSCETKML